PVAVSQDSGPMLLVPLAPELESDIGHTVPGHRQDVDPGQPDERVQARRVADEFGQNRLHLFDARRVSAVGVDAPRPGTWVVLEEGPDDGCGDVRLIVEQVAEGSSLRRGRGRLVLGEYRQAVAVAGDSAHEPRPRREFDLAVPGSATPRQRREG